MKERPKATAPAVPTATSGTYRSKTEQRLKSMMSNPLGMLALTLVGLLLLTYPFLDEWLKFRKITDIIPIIVLILLALGLNVVVGYAGLLDLGYAAFFAIGAYVAGFMTSPLSFLNQNGMQWYSNFWVAIVVAFFVAILAGVILGAPTLRLRGDYLAIVTLGFGEIVPVLFRNADTYTYGEKGLRGISKPEIDIGVLGWQYELGGGPVFGLGAWSSLMPWYYFLLAIGILTVFGLRRLQDSRIGRAWMAMREDEIAASAMGINLVTTKLSAFGMGASLSGVAGAVFGAYIGSIFPSQFEFSLSVILLCAVILGGLGNIWGVIIGSFIIQFFDRIMSLELTKFLVGVGKDNNIDFLASIQLSNWRYFIFGIALVILMLVRPEGLIPSGRRKAELRPELDTLQGDTITGEPGLEPMPQQTQARQTLYEARETSESAQEER
ncbi:MAG TPA: branched-chain amino acid ABC transporter permease [Chloroflexia bacterium]|nr:branched-chain amino acid ABC transporter permease [Chloroflexia bacterium]